MPCISLAAHFNKWQGFSFAAQQSERKKKTSLHVPCEAVRNALTETRREVSALRFPLQGVVSRNFSRFTGRLLCSIANCLSARTGGSADFSPPYRFNCLSSFFLSLPVHDLRLHEVPNVGRLVGGWRQGRHKFSEYRQQHGYIVCHRVP